jgi:hypothetical protein
MIEVPVSGVQRKIVLQNQSCKPHIVGRNRCALLSKLPEHGRIVMGSLVVREECVHAVLEEKLSQDPLILRLPAPVRESGPKLTDDDEGQENRLGFFQKDHGFRHSLAEIDVSIGVEGHSHRQRSSSTRS